MLKHIKSDLYKATIGLGNLKLTYNNDIKFCCDIDTLLQDINSKIEKSRIITLREITYCLLTCII